MGNRSAVPRCVALHPEPARLWIRRSFSSWPSPAAPWVDLATGALGGLGTGEVPQPDAVSGDGNLTYLPPVEGAHERHRRDLAASLVAEGTPVLLQACLGSTTAPLPGAHRVVDPLACLLAGDLGQLSSVPDGALVVWPLIAGLTDGEELRREGCRRLKEAGAATVQGLSLAIDPRERRRLLTQSDEEAFHRLFHAATVDERAFSAEVAAHGLDPFWVRPGVGSDRRSSNQQVAEVLALGGELCLRCGLEVKGQGLYRASRWADEAGVDLRALALEGNSQIVPWLRGAALEIVTEWSETGRSARVQSWLADYLREPREGHEDGGH